VFDAQINGGDAEIHLDTNNCYIYTQSNVNLSAYEQQIDINRGTGVLTIKNDSLATPGRILILNGLPTLSPYTSQTFTSTSIDLLQADGTGYIRRNAAGNIIDTAVGNIQTQATSTINTVEQTIFTGGVSRTLIGNNIQQPILQYGYVSTTGISGNITVTIPQRYTNATSYIPFANITNDTSATFYVSSLTRGSFSITYVNSLVGTSIFAWNTMGL
jgi:hypothetical protein